MTDAIQGDDAEPGSEQLPNGPKVQLRNYLKVEQQYAAKASSGAGRSRVLIDVCPSRLVEYDTGNWPCDATQAVLNDWDKAIQALRLASEHQALRTQLLHYIDDLKRCSQPAGRRSLVDSDGYRLPSCPENRDVLDVLRLLMHDISTCLAALGPAAALLRLSNKQEKVFKYVCELSLLGGASEQRILYFHATHEEDVCLSILEAKVRLAVCEERLQDIMKQSASTTLTHKDFSDGHMERLVSCHAVHQIVFSLWKLIASPDEQQKLISKWMGTLQPIQTNGITVHSNCAVLAQLIAELVGTSRRRSKKARDKQWEGPRLVSPAAFAALRVLFNNQQEHMESVRNVQELIAAKAAASRKDDGLGHDKEGTPIAVDKHCQFPGGHEGKDGTSGAKEAAAARVQANELPRWNAVVISHEPAIAEGLHLLYKDICGQSDSWALTQHHHGCTRQQDRKTVMAMVLPLSDFHRGKCRILFATPLALRGQTLPSIRMLVHFDLLDRGITQSSLQLKQAKQHSGVNKGVDPQLRVIASAASQKKPESDLVVLLAPAGNEECRRRFMRYRLLRGEAHSSYQERRRLLRSAMKPTIDDEEWANMFGAFPEDIVADSQARIGQKNEELPSVSICPAVPRALLCHSKRRHQRSRRLYLYALRYTLCPDEARSCPAAAKECESEELELLQPIGILLLRPLPVSLPPFYTWLQSGVRAVVTLEWCGPVKLADKQLAQLQLFHAAMARYLADGLGCTKGSKTAATARSAGQTESIQDERHEAEPHDEAMGLDLKPLFDTFGLDAEKFRVKSKAAQHGTLVFPTLQPKQATNGMDSVRSAPNDTNSAGRDQALKQGAQDKLAASGTACAHDSVNAASAADTLEQHAAADKANDVGEPMHPCCIEDDEWACSCLGVWYVITPLNKVKGRDQHGSSMQVADGPDAVNSTTCSSMQEVRHDIGSYTLAAQSAEDGEQHNRVQGDSTGSDAVYSSDVQTGQQLIEAQQQQQQLAVNTAQQLYGIAWPTVARVIHGKSQSIVNFMNVDTYKLNGLKSKLSSAVVTPYHLKRRLTANRRLWSAIHDGLLLTPYNKGEMIMYRVQCLRADMTPLSPFPEDDQQKHSKRKASRVKDSFKTFQEYFDKRYNITSMLPGQPMVEARRGSKPRDFNPFVPPNHNLARRKQTKADSKNHPSMEPQYLPPELCTLHPMPMSAWRAVGALPGLMHRVQGLLVAAELLDKVSPPQLDPSCRPPVHDVLEAITVATASEGFDLERYELLGDSLLKYATARYLYLSYYDIMSEGDMSGIKLQWVANLNLAKLCRGELRLHQMLRLARPGLNEAMLPGLEDAPPPRLYEVQGKVLADVIESLIGVFHYHCGPNVAVAFLSHIGFVPRLADDSDDWLGQVHPVAELLGHPLCPEPWEKWPRSWSAEHSKSPDVQCMRPQGHQTQYMSMHLEADTAASDDRKHCSPQVSSGNGQTHELTATPAMEDVHIQPDITVQITGRVGHVQSVVYGNTLKRHKQGARPVQVDPHPLGHKPSGACSNTPVGASSACTQQTKPLKPQLCKTPATPPHRPLFMGAAGSRSPKPVEQTLGYVFHDLELLREACTHPVASYSRQVKGSQEGSSMTAAAQGEVKLAEVNYQKLEFLGDAVLDILQVQWLYHHYQHLDPGRLSRLKEAALNNERLARVAVDFGLHEYLDVGGIAQLNFNILDFVNKLQMHEGVKPGSKSVAAFLNNQRLTMAQQHADAMMSSPEDLGTQRRETDLQGSNMHQQSPQGGTATVSVLAATQHVAAVNGIAASSSTNEPPHDDGPSSGSDEKPASAGTSATYGKLEKRAPKELGDLIESLCGAVYLDCGQDMIITWQVMEPLLSPMPSPDHIVLQPKVELTDRLAKAGIMPEYVVEAVADDATAVSCRVLGCGRLLGYAPSAMSKHVAEKLAAQDALNHAERIEQLLSDIYDAGGPDALRALQKHNEQQLGQQLLQQEMQKHAKHKPQLRLADDGNASDVQKQTATAAASEAGQKSGQQQCAGMSEEDPSLQRDHHQQQQQPVVEGNDAAEANQTAATSTDARQQGAADTADASAEYQHQQQGGEDIAQVQNEAQTDDVDLSDLSSAEGDAEEDEEQREWRLMTAVKEQHRAKNPIAEDSAALPAAVGISATDAKATIGHEALTRAIAVGLSVTASRDPAEQESRLGAGDGVLVSDALDAALLADLADAEADAMELGH